jgi:transposase
MDRASFHRKTKLEETGKAHEVFLLYLPPYAPDFNPIEKTWANRTGRIKPLDYEFDALEMEDLHPVPPFPLIHGNGLIG